MIPFQLQGSTALFTTRTPTEDEIRSLYDDRIELTDDATWDPGGIPGIVTVNVNSNASDVLRMKDDVPSEGLRVCATMERDAGYIEDAGDYRLLAGISTALTDASKHHHTLANPNQCRSFGISWCDDAWDPHRLLVLIAKAQT